MLEITSYSILHYHLRHGAYVFHSVYQHVFLSVITVARKVLNEL